MGLEQSTRYCWRPRCALMSQMALSQTSKYVMGRIRAGDSVLGKTKQGNTLLHIAAANLDTETLALLFDLPLFDDLVGCYNNVGKRAHELVGDQCSASDRDSSTARVVASELSRGRTTRRAACLLWCMEQVGGQRTLASWLLVL
jgi:hypothetical protein